MNIDKIHPTLRRALDTTVRAQQADGVPLSPLPVIVRWQSPPAPTPPDSVDAPPAGDMQVTTSIPMLSATAGFATPEAIFKLSDSEQIEMIWMDETVYATLDTSISLLGVPQVWESGNLGTGIRLCVIDSGVDGNHPDLADNFMGEQDYTGEGIGDANGHGTHVASIAVGSGKASDGKYRGVAPGAKLYSAKVLNSRGLGKISVVVAGLEWALSQGAQIINLSLGTEGVTDDTDPLSKACNMLVEMGVVVVVAAGNAGPGPNSVTRPGSAERVITVGAVSDTDDIAEFSGRGPTDDGRVKPDLVVPGVSVIAARAAGITPEDTINKFYYREQGTSMAAPHVSGIAALMLAANPALTPDEIKTLMKQAAVKIPNISENAQGAGRLMAARAVGLARRHGNPSPHPHPSSGNPVDPATPSSPPADPPLSQPPRSEPEGCLAALFPWIGR